MTPQQEACPHPRWFYFTADEILTDEHSKSATQRQCKECDLVEPLERKQ